MKKELTEASIPTGENFQIESVLTETAAYCSQTKAFSAIVE